MAGNNSLLISFFVLICYTINAQELRVQASRSSGVAPLYVFFDATSSTGLSQGNDFVNADFSWDFDLNNTDENSQWKNTKGMVAGHVFEIPGTYTVQCTLTTPNGASSTVTSTILVSDFSGTTYYVSASGNDANEGLSESTSWQTANHAFGQLTPNSRVLFNRGDSFTNVSHQLQNLSGGPIRIGAYGIGEPPVLIGTLNGSIELDYVDDIVFSDLHLVMNGTGVGNFSIEYSENVLLLNLELEGSSSLANYFDDCNLIGVFDTYIHDFGVLAIYSGNSTRFSWVGNIADNLIGTPQAEHGIRIQGGEKQFIAHNTLTNLIDTKSALQIRGDGQRHVMIYQNKMDRILGINPQNAATMAAISQVVIEANYIGQNQDYTGSLRENSINGINIEATNISVRNNVIDGYRNAINVSHDYNGVVSGQVDVYHNTVNWRSVSPQSNNGGRIVNVRDVSGVNVRNNLITAPNIEEASIVGYSGENTSIVEDGNRIATTSIYETPDLPSSAAHTNDITNFRIADSNGENIIGNIDIPVFYDALGAPRSTSAPKVGAFELQTEVSEEEQNPDSENPDIATEWNLFFNPAQRKVYIQCPLDSGTVTIAVFNLNGQLVMQRQMATVDKELLELNVSSFPTGYYVISLKSSIDNHYQGFINFE